MALSLVLGANGFIGSHLVDSLVADGHKVRAFDRFSSGDVSFDQHEHVEIYAGNYLNSDDLKQALKGVDYVFHFISTTTPASAENDPTIDIDTNIRMSVELFQLCVEAGVKRVLFASTGGTIYGLSESDTPHKEDDLALPVSPYAIGKLTIEHYLRYFRVKHGLQSTVFRISNPYGERQPFHRKQGVIPIFLENIHRNIPLTVLGDGSMVRDYVYVKDVTDAISRVFEGDFMYDVYNMGSGEGKSINEIVDAAKTATGIDPEVVHVEAPRTYTHKVVLDTTRFEHEFGHADETSLEVGIAKTNQFIQDEIQKERD